MVNQTKEIKKKLKIKKLKISEKAKITQKGSKMSGCGKYSDSQCGISARSG